MATPHQEFADLAEEMIREEGRPLTIKKLSREPADAARPWKAGASSYEDSVDVMGVVTEYDEDEVDGTQIVRGDRRILIAAKPISGKSLEDFDTVFDGDRPFSIVRCYPLKPGTTLILYDIQARQ